MELCLRTAPLDQPEAHGAEQCIDARQHEEQREPRGREVSRSDHLDQGGGGRGEAGQRDAGRDEAFGGPVHDHSCREYASGVTSCATFASHDHEHDLWMLKPAGTLRIRAGMTRTRRLASKAAEQDNTWSGSARSRANVDARFQGEGTQMPEGDSKGISRRRGSQRVRAALALLVVATYAPGSAAQEDDLASAAPPERRLPSDWSFEFGGGALALPSFPGAASTKVIPLPWVDLHYKDRLFLSPISGLGVNLVAVPGARLGVALLPDLGRSASSNNRLRGWGDIGAGADLRLFGQLRVLGPLAVLAGVRRQLGGGNGTVVDG